jgi:putative Mg2+ transporter-C (MgtC) family protein
VNIELELTLRILLSGALGALVGFQRERENSPAGIRTYMMVCLGACLFCVVSAYGFGTSSDPSRVAAQVATGIGFIGAGTIFFMRREGTVMGLASAATIFAMAAVGLSVGAGMYLIAGVATAVIFGALWIPHRL